ncbi:uncharacterized protein LOC142177175 [Nicotiana tabacum]|uniref:Uncharacterized protein LOC142177175 n=1 Tax=Nicotiana tabacum TaxID=4097 RepID=A0AC58TWZ5_TOBAC
MKVALVVKNKLDFIDGSCKREDYRGDLVHEWDMCNAFVLSWITNSVSRELTNELIYSSNAYNVWVDLKECFDKRNLTRVYQLHREIYTMVQGTSSVSEYFSKLRNVWDEYLSLVPFPGSDKTHADHIEQQKLMQFLMGLNETYSQSRNQILMTGNKFKKANILYCDYCHMRGHKRENFYKLVGYPANSKNTKRRTSDRFQQTGNDNRLSCQVHLPNGQTTSITHIGPVSLFHNILTNVLYDLYNGKVRGIGKEKDGLYLLQPAKRPSPVQVSIPSTSLVPSHHCLSSSESDYFSIWHQRLGHAYFLPVAPSNCCALIPVGPD